MTLFKSGSASVLSQALCLDLQIRQPMMAVRSILWLIALLTQSFSFFWKTVSLKMKVVTLYNL